MEEKIHSKREWEIWNTAYLKGIETGKDIALNKYREKEGGKASNQKTD